MAQDEVELEAGGSMKRDAALDEAEPEAAADESTADEAAADAEAEPGVSSPEAADEPAAADGDEVGQEDGAEAPTAAAAADGDGADDGPPPARAEEHTYLDDPEGQAEAAAAAGDSEDEEPEPEAKPEGQQGEDEDEAEEGGAFSYGAAADAASVAAAGGGEEDEEEEEQEEEQQEQQEDEEEEAQKDDDEEVAAADDEEAGGYGAGAAGAEEAEAEAEADLGAVGGDRAASFASSSSLPPIASSRSQSHTAAAATAAPGAAASGQHLPAAAQAAAAPAAPPPAKQAAAKPAPAAASKQPYAMDGRGGGGGGARAGAAAPRKAAVPAASQGRSPTRQPPASRSAAAPQAQTRASRSPARASKPAAASSPSSPPVRLRPNPSPQPPQAAGTRAAPAASKAAAASKKQQQPQQQPQQHPVPRLRDALAADVPDADSITQQYLRLLQTGALNKSGQQQQRPSTAPDAAEGGGAGSGSAPAVAGAISAPGTAPSGGRGKARPGSGVSAGSGASGQQSVHAAELARLQARSAWADNVAPVSRKTTPSSTTHADGLGATSPRGGAHGLAHLPPLHLAHGAASAPGSRSGSPRSRSFRALRQDVPSKVFSPRPSTSAAPYTKLYTPGPGAYDPLATRHGDASWLGGGTVTSLGSAGGTGGGFGSGTGGFGSGRGLSGSPPRSWSFGGAAARPPHVCIPHAVDSPGPVYLPSKEGLSTLSSTGTYKFDRQLPGARFSLTAGVPPNAPLFNPGPGAYDPSVTPAGDPVSPSPLPAPAGGGAPSHAFPRARKGLNAASNPAALPIISREQAAHEYMGIHSPGPAAYSPELSPTRPAPPAYSSPGRAARSWVDPEERSPGPVYKPADMDRSGRHTLGDGPQAVIGTGPKGYDPVGALSASPWISLDAARRVNYGIHSPGPGTYSPPLNPRLVAGNIAVPALGAGPPDRFAGRSEPGRLQ
ncbi:hypothetical protein HXX76_008065 [Chlamydomonas incerta]|uniref:Uncharacterized protein n=1 Tax=Chlamydomonas incerta TaxID=51695 RepID=A0A835T755_CHLIN|nr:hypothetical protein HXX76_008065 [Chlamydomonas incerta]|eukprot:KAG2433695.1 hypothetical protein HXX76_008065 [Chlamydomonas incerta]